MDRDLDAADRRRADSSRQGVESGSSCRASAPAADIFPLPHPIATRHARSLLALALAATASAQATAPQRLSQPLHPRPVGPTSSRRGPSPLPRRTRPPSTSETPIRTRHGGTARGSSSSHPPAAPERASSHFTSYELWGHMAWVPPTRRLTRSAGGAGAEHDLDCID